MTDTGRRRRSPDAENVSSVEESFGAPGRMVETARRQDPGRSLLVRWRRHYRDGELAVGFELPRVAPLTIPEQEVCRIASERARRKLLSRLRQLAWLKSHARMAGA
jgi:transposase-like protein